MKKIIVFLLMLICVSSFGQLTEVGVFNGGRGEKIPIKLYGILVQENENGNLIPRGGNFLENGMVRSKKKYLSNLLKNTYTDYGGLLQPTNVFCPDGFVSRWFYDSAYNVVGNVFVKNGNSLDDTYSTKEEALRLIKVVDLKVPETKLEIQETFVKGLSGDSSYEIDNQGSLWYWNGNGNFRSENAWSQMNVSYNPTTGRIKTLINTTGFGLGNIDGSYVMFKIEVSPLWYTKEEIEAIDFRNQKGKDISIIGANFHPNGEIMDSKQSIVHIAGDETSDVPSFFKRASDKRIGSPAYFPDFSMSNKLNIISYGSLNDNNDYENHLYLNKGYNVVARTNNPLVPLNKSIATEYDDWAIKNGCPARGADGITKQAEAVLWLQNTPMKDLYEYYKEIINVGGQYEVLFANFEVWGFAVLNNPVACAKLGSLYREFKRANPNTILLSYINIKPIRVTYSDKMSEEEMRLQNQKYNQSYNELVEGFFGKYIEYLDLNNGNPTGVFGYVGDNFGAGIVGDYMIYSYNSQFYSFIQELELFKKHLPNKSSLSLYWSNIEQLPGVDKKRMFTLSRYYKKPNGFFYKMDYRMAAPMSDAYNRAMWANFLGKGQMIWCNPGSAMNGFQYHGGDGRSVETGEYLENSVSDYIFDPTGRMGSTQVSTTLGYDYNQLALYELSMNNDIIGQDAKYTEYSIDNGVTYYSGDDLKPASAEFKRLPIVRIKKHPLLNEWLVLAMNKHLEHFENQTVKVKIGSNTVDIVLKGQFSTLKRVKMI